MRSAEMIENIHDDLKEPNHFLYKGVRVHQPRSVFAALDKLEDELIVFDPRHLAGQAKMIIEIGATFGGFTQILADHALSVAAEMHSFDINDYGGLRDERVNWHLGADVFSANTSTEIIALVQRSGRALVFCDNGNKAREINLYAPHLKPGDVIFGHDYARTPAEHSPLWGWEFELKEVKETLDANGFEPFLEATMQRAAWGSWLKVR